MSSTSSITSQLAGRVEAERERAVVVQAERELDLVAVVPDRRVVVAGAGRDDRLELDRRVVGEVEVAEAFERVADLALLLGRAARRSRSVCHRAPGCGARSGTRFGTGLEHFDDPRLGEVLLAAGDLGDHAVAGQAAARENDEAVGAADARAAMGERLDRRFRRARLFAVVRGLVGDSDHCIDGSGPSSTRREGA